MHVDMVKLFFGHLVLKYVLYKICIYHEKKGISEKKVLSFKEEKKKMKMKKRKEKLFLLPLAHEW